MHTCVSVCAQDMKASCIYISVDQHGVPLLRIKTLYFYIILLNIN